MILTKDVTQKDIDEMSAILEELHENRTIPEKYPDSIGSYGFNIPFEIRCSDSYPFSRERFTRKYGFNLVSLDWVRLLATELIKDSKCLEIMCGSGMLSKAFRECGVDIIATDNNSWARPDDDSKISFDSWLSKSFVDIEELDAVDAVEKYGAYVDFVIVSWPYMDDTCYQALMKMREVNPNCRMIFIGEDWGGCTANDNFFEAFNIVGDVEEGVELPDDELKDVCTIGLANDLHKQWSGMHDIIMLGK